MRKRLFISCVTSEFADFRKLLAGDLLRSGYDVTVQEHFAVAGHTLLEKLDRYVRESDTVIHLIGTAPGAYPQIDETVSFLNSHPDFIRKVGLIGDTDSPSTLTMSYTQWEVWLGLFYSKSCLVFVHGPLAKVDVFDEANQSRSDSQWNHLLRLRKRGQECAPIDTREDFRLGVLQALSADEPHHDPNPTADDCSLICKDEWSRIQPESYRNSWPLIIFCGFSLLIGLVSATLAYFGPTVTEAWSLRFDRLENANVPVGTGYAIEAVRLVLFLVSTCAVCVYRFADPLRRFFSLTLHTGTVWTARVIVVLLLFFFLNSEVARHWNADGAGTDMLAWARQHNIETTAELESRPYRVFLPYSICIYIFVFIGLIACPLLQFLLSDFHYLRRRLERLRDNQARATTSKTKLALLLQFGQGTRELTARYIDAAGVLAIGIQYDFWIGRYTLTDSGYTTEMLAWIVTAITIVLFFAICHIYSQAMEATSKVLDAQDLEAERVLNQHSLFWLVRTSLLNRTSGLILLSLLLIGIVALLRRDSHPVPLQETMRPTWSLLDKTA